MEKGSTIYLEKYKDGRQHFIILFSFMYLGQNTFSALNRLNTLDSTSATGMINTMS
jgi:hypothetical protein